MKRKSNSLLVIALFVLLLISTPILAADTGTVTQHVHLNDNVPATSGTAVIRIVDNRGVTPEVTLTRNSIEEAAYYTEIAGNQAVLKGEGAGEEAPLENVWGGNLQYTVRGFGASTYKITAEITDAVGGEMDDSLYVNVQAPRQNDTQTSAAETLGTVVDAEVANLGVGLSTAPKTIISAIKGDDTYTGTDVVSATKGYGATLTYNLVKKPGMRSVNVMYTILGE